MGVKKPKFRNKYFLQRKVEKKKPCVFVLQFNLEWLTDELFLKSYFMYFL